MAMLTGITEIGQDGLIEMMDHAILHGTNLMTFGPAGIGKTEIAIQRVAKAGMSHIYLNLSVLEAPDLLGLPRTTEKGKTTYALPDKFPTINEGDPMILIVDELDKARPELQNPMLELFQFRSINGMRLNIKGVLATGNLPDENAFSQPVSHALMNRCSVFKTVCAFDPWRDWAVESNVNPLIVAFLSRNPNLLLQPPPDGDDTAYCHGSPRSWTLAAKDIDFAPDRSVDFHTLLVAGRVGQGSAAKFRVWLDHYRHIQPYIDALVKDGTHPPDDIMSDLERKFVFGVSGANEIVKAAQRGDAAKSDKEKAEAKARVERVTNNVMGWMGTIPSEYTIGAMKSVLTMEMITKYQLVDNPKFMMVFTKIRKAWNR